MNEAKKVSPINSEMDTLEKVIVALKDDVNTLESRLDYALRPRTPQPEKPEAGIERDSESALVARVRRLQYHIAQIREVTGSVMERLEL